jgi:hypothetical protein
MLLLDNKLGPDRAETVERGKGQLFSRGVLFVAMAMAVLSSAPAEATTIAIVGGAQQIVVSADSKVRHTTQPSVGCKLHRTGKVFWVMAGVADQHSNWIDYNVARIVNQSVAQDGTVGGAFEAFKENVKTPMHQLVSYLYNSHPEQLREQKDAILQIMFFGFEHGKPQVYFAGYGAAGDAIVYGANGFQNCNKGCFMVLGLRTPNYIETHHDWYLHPVATAIGLVRASIVARPDSVGYPINTMVVHQNDSYEWVNRSVVCPATLDSSLDTPDLHN